MKKRKFQTGGDVEEKKRKGLGASAGEKVGFFERLRMGNIDDPTSKAYKKFGAGRGSSEIQKERETIRSSKSAPNPYQGDDVDSFSAARDASGNINRSASTNGDKSGVKAASPEPAVKPEKAEPQNFSQAFAAARRTGKDTFTFKGKKYTTELKKPKAEPPKAEPPKAEKAEPPKTPSSTAKAAQPAARPTGTPGDPYGKIARIMERVRNPDNPRIRREREELESAKGMKKGGMVKSSASKRADGIAQRGKTKCKIC